MNSCALPQVPQDLRKKKGLLCYRDRWKHKDSRRKKTSDKKKRGKQELLHNNKLKKKLGLNDCSKNKRQQKGRQKFNGKCWIGENK